MKAQSLSGSTILMFVTSVLPLHVLTQRAGRSLVLVHSTQEDAGAMNDHPSRKYSLMSNTSREQIPDQMDSIVFCH
jgi:hypothetical protein